MKDAVKESSYAKKDQAPDRKERVEEAPKSEPDRVDAKEKSPAQEVDSSRREEASPSYAEETATATHQDSLRNSESETSDQDASISERVDALLELLNADGSTDIHVLLQSLVQQFNLDSETINLNSVDGPSAQQQQLLSLLKGQGTKAVDLLVQAGLTQEQANNLLNKIQQGQVSQAALQSAEEAADDVLLKLNGERAVEGKSQFLSQFSDLNKQVDKPQRQASIEKVLTQAAKAPALDANQKPLENNPATTPKLGETFQLNNQQANSASLQNPANALLQKNNDGLKAPTEVKVQSVNAISDSAARPLEGAKSVSAEILSARGTTEAKVINQILNKFSLRTSGSQSEIKIKLDPPALGTIRMNVSTSGDTVRTVVIAENHAVKQIIENNLTQLRDSMSGQGLKVDSFTVLVGGNDGQTGQQNTPHEGRSHYAGLPSAESNPTPEMPGEIPAAGGTRTYLHDTQSISVFA